MTVTFLVELNLDDVSTLADIALDIEDDLARSYDVVSVKPWQRPTLQQATGSAFVAPVDPNIQVPPTF